MEENVSEAGGVHSEENKAFPDKNKKRRLKTPSQVEALEKFYNEHKYPTETMKAALAEKIGLTEKQVSGWFCHRRLKDKKLLQEEAYANGRQDRSSGVIQDRGSGLRQDSCGSTKQGDYRLYDPKEVESQRFYSEDLLASDLNYEHGRQYTGNLSAMDDISSGSSSPLQESFYNQNEDPCDMGSSRYLTQYRSTVPSNARGIKSRGHIGPSGYLKVKGEVENGAITTVKRQLGRHYREDGPPLGVEFQPLPPGAFEVPTTDPVNEAFHVGHPILPPSPDVPGAPKPSNHSMRYEASRMSFLGSDMEGEDKIMHGCQGNYSHQQSKPKLSLPIHSNPFPGENYSRDINEDPVRETSTCNTSRNRQIRSKLGIEGMGLDFVSTHERGPFVGKVSSKQTELWLHDYDDDIPKTIYRKDRFDSKSSNLVVEHDDSHDTEERDPHRKMVKEKKLYGKRRAMKEYLHPFGSLLPTSEMKVVKRVRDDFPEQGYATKTSFLGRPQRANPIKGSAVDGPSSFSEDETAETGSSHD